MRLHGAAATVVLLLASAAASAEDRDYCPTRPGLNTTPCTLGTGRVSVETALGDWTRDDGADARTDTVLIGETLVRLGVSDGAEVQVGWSPFGHVRTRDLASGAVESRNRTGDLILASKVNLSNPDGKKFALAVKPFVSLPVGRVPVGDGDWGTGMIVPATFALTEAVKLQFTGEADAAVNEDHHGRHLAYSGVGGVGIELSKAVSIEVEMEALRDEDPMGATTQTFAALATAWKPTHDLQLDIGGVAGLNRDSATVRLYAGISRRF